MVNEQWSDIKGYEGYYRISNTGKIYSIKSNIMLKQSNSNKGYHSVKLQRNGIKKTYRVHRLVAMTFIPNPTGLLEVNHIDEDKSNNLVTNLEWMSHTDNVNHGTRNSRASDSLKIANARPIVAIFKNGVTKTYGSASQCAKLLGLSAGNINSVIRGTRNHTHGIRFQEL